MIVETPASTGPVIPTPIRSGFLILTGTMVTEDQQLAFFNGSQTEFNRVVSLSDQIAGCSIVTIATSHVDLKRGDQTIVLPVGKQLTLDPNAATLAAPSDPAPTPEIAAAPASAGPSPETPGAPPAPGTISTPPDRAELIRRMMERRQKENAK